MSKKCHHRPERRPYRRYQFQPGRRIQSCLQSGGADKVYGMKYGIEGLLKEEMLELNVLLDDRMSIELLKRTPSSYLGSCRYKLPDPDVDSTPVHQAVHPV